MGEKDAGRNTENTYEDKGEHMQKKTKYTTKTNRQPKWFWWKGLPRSSAWEAFDSKQKRAAFREYSSSRKGGKKLK